MTGPSGSAATSAADPSTRPSRRVFTNRNLRMTSIEAMGFDMDHTLAVYNTDNFNRLCFELAIDRLVRDKGYPEAVRSVRWDPAAAIRGLIVDKRLGNLLKVDAHGHITRVRHGFRFLDKDERRHLYPRGRIRIGNARYRIFDTLFDLPEGSLYAAIIDLAEQRGAGAGPVAPRPVRRHPRHHRHPARRRLPEDAHRGGPGPLLPARSGPGAHPAPAPGGGDEAVPAHQLGGRTTPPRSWTTWWAGLRARGRTCSTWSSASPASRASSWPAGAGKPVPAGSNPLMPNRRGVCFTGGDAFFLERKLGCRGDGILYWGDHTYGDILRSKKSVGWRTAMIVPEVEEEIEALVPLAAQRRELAAVEERLEELVLEQDRLAAAAQGDHLTGRRARAGEAPGRGPGPAGAPAAGAAGGTQPPLGVPLPRGPRGQPFRPPDHGIFLYLHLAG